MLEKLVAVTPKGRFHTEDCLCGEKKIVLHFIAKNHSLYHCGTYEYSLS